ncbi:MAG: DUF4276 family protein [Desulfobacteraceae bacterium]|jgi:hypothetical protein|nr:DUF4276 family protein [Desulfobacteraceae bacterium]
MSDYAEIVVLVEGKTEQIFIQDIVSPYLAGRGVYIKPIIISKPGQKGGDVKFVRVKNDIELHLKQRPDTYLTLFVDFYGIMKDWPGLEEAKRQTTPSGKAETINTATKSQVNVLFGGNDSERRFIPYVAMHEFEAMLFSEPEELASQLGISVSQIDKILKDCGEPEQIDDSPQTAPSKRLEDLSRRFKKTSTGIAIAKATGLAKIRNQCPLFNKWLTDIENLEGLKHG